MAACIYPSRPGRMVAPDRRAALGAGEAAGSAPAAMRQRHPFADRWGRAKFTGLLALLVPFGTLAGWLAGGVGEPEDARTSG